MQSSQLLKLFGKMSFIFDKWLVGYVSSLQDLLRPPCPLPFCSIVSCMWKKTAVNNAWHSISHPSQILPGLCLCATNRESLVAGTSTKHHQRRAIREGIGQYLGERVAHPPKRKRKASFCFKGLGKSYDWFMFGVVGIYCSKALLLVEESCTTKDDDYPIIYRF